MTQPAGNTPRSGRRILRSPEVAERTKLSESTRRRLAATGDFPKPVALGRRAVGWFEDEIDAWLEGRAGRRHA